LIRLRYMVPMGRSRTNGRNGGMAALWIRDIEVICAIRVVRLVNRWRTTPGSGSSRPLTALLTLVLFMIAGCASDPGQPYTLDASPLRLVDGAGVNTVDQRGRFREIVCAVNEESGRSFPGYRPCSEILHHFFDESPGSGKAVNLGAPRLKIHIALVGGLGAECFAYFVRPFHFALEHLRSLGYQTSYIRVDGLSSSATNGREIRDAVLDMDHDTTNEHLVLLGYSKGAPDIIEGLVSYPELQERVAAVITVAGAVNGSPLSNDAPEWALSLLEYLPGSECKEGDGEAVESLKPATRHQFTSIHKLPEGVAYYSLATFAPREQISIPLRSGYDELSKIDPRNDGQMLFYDQVIPGGNLLGFVKSDHWAVAMPISRQYPTLAAVLIDHNEFPREVLLEAAVRHVEGQLLTSRSASFARQSIAPHNEARWQPF